MTLSKTLSFGDRALRIIFSYTPLHSSLRIYQSNFGIDPLLMEYKLESVHIWCDAAIGICRSLNHDGVVFEFHMSHPERCVIEGTKMRGVFFEKALISSCYLEKSRFYPLLKRLL